MGKLSTHPFNPRPQGRGKWFNGIFEPNFGSKIPRSHSSPFPFWEGGWGMGKFIILKHIIMESRLISVSMLFNLQSITTQI